MIRTANLPSKEEGQKQKPVHQNCRRGNYRPDEPYVPRIPNASNAWVASSGGERSQIATMLIRTTDATVRGMEGMYTDAAYEKTSFRRR